MSDDIFDAQILSEKLSKLNSSQQSIESVSSWCITYRNKAKEIVEIWDSSFNSARKERVAFLYLANDILQNSRRKGSEYVNEFWKVLPAALNNVFQSTDDHGKKAATRLMDIWEERRVFGSRAQNLKDELLDKDPLAKINNRKSSNPTKTVKREAHSLRFKLPVGSTTEKIVTAFQSVHDAAEEDALDKYKAAVSCLEKIETLEGSADEIHAQESILQECMKQLHSAEANRSSLVTILKAVLMEQESKVETIQSHLQIAQSLIDQMNHTRRHQSSIFTNTVLVTAPSTTIEPKIPPPQQKTSSLISLDHQPPADSLKTISEDDNNNKSAAAVLAAKLTASSSSMEVLSSVLSSLVAEGSSSMNHLMTSSSSSIPVIPPPEKRTKLDPTSTTTFLPPFVPPSAGLMMAYPYNNSNNNGLQPPPHHFPMARPGPPPLPPSSSSQLANNTSVGYYHLQSGMGMYGQGQQPSPSSSTPQGHRL